MGAWRLKSRGKNYSSTVWFGMGKADVMSHFILGDLFHNAFHHSFGLLSQAQASEIAGPIQEIPASGIRTLFTAEVVSMEVTVTAGSKKWLQSKMYHNLMIQGDPSLENNFPRR